ARGRIIGIYVRDAGPVSVVATRARRAVATAVMVAIYSAVGATARSSLLQFRRTGRLQSQIQSVDVGTDIRNCRRRTVSAGGPLRDCCRVQRRRATAADRARTLARGPPRGSFARGKVQAARLGGAPRAEASSTARMNR